MFRPFFGGPQQQQQAQPPPTTHSWYPPSVMGPANSGPSRLPPPPALGTSSSGINPLSRPPTSSSNDVRPILGSYPLITLPGSSSSTASLRDKSADELNRLLNDKDAYNAFLHSLDEVRRLDKIGEELRKSTIDESRNNLAKESEIAELRNQCMIIRNTELAASQEKFAEVENRYKEVQSYCSPSALLEKLQDAANEADEESENLHRRFVAGELDMIEYIRMYRKQRLLYHRRSLIRMAALTSVTTPGPELIDSMASLNFELRSKKAVWVKSVWESG